ncbi:MAG: hypothetical protein JWO86_5690 [Myxococcaceae bacterium]|nr:hypothetical protein [Myxococcaceae bacterium]
MNYASREREPFVWWHPLISLGLIVAANAAIASGGSRRGSPVALFLRLMMGPFSFEREMRLDDWAFFAVNPASFAAVLPLAIYVARGTLAGLIVGSILWFLAGYLFCVAIWI